MHAQLPEPDSPAESLAAHLETPGGWEYVPAPYHATPPEMPCPTTLLDPDRSTEQQITTLVEADALLAATTNVRLGQKLAEMVETTDDIELLRKVYDTFGRRANLVENRKAPTSSQVPLTIVFERAPVSPGQVIDIRSGAQIAAARRAAQGVTPDAPTTVTVTVPSPQ